MTSRSLLPSRREAVSEHPMTVRRALLVAGAVALSAAGCTNPRTEAAMVQELNDAATEIGAMKSDIGQLQNDVDSLKLVVARQDTVISRLVEVTHVPR